MGFVSAVKDVTAEAEEIKSSALGQLRARTVRSKVNLAQSITDLRNEARDRYQALLDAEQLCIKGHLQTPYKTD